jgi:GrpB-like predicted nucleotidyltransferase (UPF0157 family)
MIGLPPNTIEIVEYDPQWVEEFKAEVLRLQEIIPIPELQFEHIGSTSVPGLSSKPIIDMLLGLSRDQHQDVAESLKDLSYSIGGYLYDPDDFLLFRQPQPLTHIIHLAPLDSQKYRDLINFRNYLLTDEKGRKEYQQLKLKMSRRLGDNRKDYGRLKGHFIKNRLELFQKKTAYK